MKLRSVHKWCSGQCSSMMKLCLVQLESLSRSQGVQELGCQESMTGCRNFRSKFWCSRCLAFLSTWSSITPNMRSNLTSQWSSWNRKTGPLYILDLLTLHLELDPLPLTLDPWPLPHGTNRELAWATQLAYYRLETVIRHAWLLTSISIELHWLDFLFNWLVLSKEGQGEGQGVRWYPLGLDTRLGLIVIGQTWSSMKDRSEVQ